MYDLINELLESATQQEIEYVFFGKPKNFDFTKKYKGTSIAQFEIRTNEDDPHKKGIVRVRRTNNKIHTMAIKYTDGFRKSGMYDVKENEFDISPDVFDAFRRISHFGFDKIRYVIPVGNNLVYEIDVFKDKHGNFNEWIKIDLEVPNESTPVPELPIEMDRLVTSQMATRGKEEQELINKVWKSFML